MTGRITTAACGELLDLRYAVRATDAALARHLRDVFADSLDDGHAGRDGAGDRVAFEVHGSPDSGHFRLVIDGEEVSTTTSPRHALSSLIWHVNRRTVARSSSRLLFHASVVDLGDRSLAFLGASGAGKTTSALLSARRFGGALVTDDIAAVEPDGTWAGAAKPLGLRDGSAGLLGGPGGRLPQPPAGYEGPTLYTAASSLAIPTAGAAPLTDIVRLTTDSDDPRASPQRRAVGFAALLEAAFDHRPLHRDEVLQVADLVRRCRFWAWRPGDVAGLDEVVEHPGPT